MKKVLLFSLFLVLGLVVSQMLPAMVGEQYSLVKTISNTFLFICLAFIMINVGREFEIDKTRWKSYTEDYFIAMATAAFPWIFVALYYYVCLASGRFMGKLGRLEGEPVAKPVRRTYLGGYLVYDVGRRRAKSLLGI